MKKLAAILLSTILSASMMLWATPAYPAACVDTEQPSGKQEPSTNNEQSSDSNQQSSRLPNEIEAGATSHESNEPVAASSRQESTNTSKAAATNPLAAASQPNATPLTAAQSNYDHSKSATQNGVTFTVEWNDAVDKTTTFHVTASGGSGEYKARMDVPTYWDNNAQESVCDPSRNLDYKTFADGAAGIDFQFDLTASGTYRFLFYFMSASDSVTYLRADVSMTVNDPARPSVTQIVNSAIAQCKAETDGSEYSMALWLHDWAIDQLEYDRTLNYCSAESGLTRGLGTCESYQRIYAKLLNAAGIANGRIEGNGHTWNAVRIDGEWCQTDLTWDDSSSTYGDLEQRHLYFGLTDELMAIAHSDHTKNYQAEGYVYRSTAPTNDYYVRNGKAREWAEAYSESIQKHLDARETEFEIDANNLCDPPSISGIKNSLVAWQMNRMDWGTRNDKVNLMVESSVETTPNASWTAKYLFKAKYALSQYEKSPEGYAQMLYAECFGTPRPTSSQITYWENVLTQPNGPTRAIHEFFTSSIFAAKNATEQAQLLYRIVAGIQQPNEFQMDYWSKYVAQNGIAGAIKEFCSSSFFAEQCKAFNLGAPSAASQKTPESYARTLYSKCLDASNTEQWKVDYWTQVLITKNGPKKAIFEFFESKTFLAKNSQEQARILYSVIAGIDAPCDFQITYWSQHINANGIEPALKEFIDSNYFANQRKAYGLG